MFKSRALLAACFLFLFSFQAFPSSVVVGNREWRQLTETKNLGYDQLERIYNIRTGELNTDVTTINGIDFSGWTWASADDVVWLFNHYNEDFIGSPVNELDSSWAPTVMSEGQFEPTHIQGANITLQGITRTRNYSFGGRALTGTVWYYSEDGSHPWNYEDSMQIGGILLNTRWSSTGIWLYREVGGEAEEDSDVDGIIDTEDNCPNTVNPQQEDTDNDGLGNACDDVNDLDFDEDGVDNSNDNCPHASNINQLDTDGDGYGDECDLDKDDDGIDNGDDNCPLIVNADQTDTDADGAGDACDGDDDDDGVVDISDNCPLFMNEDQADLDGDGIGDQCDTDKDGDGVGDVDDNCPLIANAGQEDLDGDSVGNICDVEADGDGIVDSEDACPGTSVGAIVNAAGCSIAQLCPCDGPQNSEAAWKNHGKYVSCVSDAAQNFVQAGLIRADEKDAIVFDAAESLCGK